MYVHEEIYQLDHKAHPRERAIAAIARQKRPLYVAGYEKRAIYAHKEIYYSDQKR